MSQTSTPKGANGRLAYLDGARALAALIVLVNHCWLTIFPFNYQRFPSGRTAMLTDWMLYGHFAVPAFLVISGFSLALVPARYGYRLPDGMLAFLKRRFVRIIPPYLLALFLAVGLSLTVIGSKTGTLWDVTLPVSLSGIVVNGLLLQDLIHARSPNSVFWSIAAEWHVYFAFPAFLYLWRTQGKRAATMMAVLFGVVSELIAFAYGHENSLPIYFTIFVFGVVVCDRVECSDNTGSWWTPLVGGLALSALVTAIVVKLPTITTLLWIPFIDVIAALAAAAFLLSASRGGPVRQLLELRFLTSLGAFSYSFYLVHAPIVQLYWQLVVRPLDVSPTMGLLIMSGCIAPALGVSWIFYVVAERPFINLSHRRRSAAKQSVALTQVEAGL